jgi:hypothetical protein
MTAASSLAFPGSRTLAGWWRQLAPLRPRALWVGHLLLHRVEALVATVRARRLDPLSRFLLQALAAEQPGQAAALPEPEDFLRRLDQRLPLGNQLLRQALRALTFEGLVEDGAQGTWALTALGREALARGEYPQAGHERRVFHFVDSGGGPDQPRRLPHFLCLNGHAGVAWSGGGDWGFDPANLEACVRQPAAWKHQHGFPEDVREILALPAATTAPPWQRVIVDRAERLAVALALTETPEKEPRLVGIPVRQEGWVLHASHPGFELGSDWHATFPELGTQPPGEACCQAWRSWCQPRSLPPEQVERCDVRPDGLHLRVAAPQALVERLQAARSDALKGEAWVLIGEGALRTAALLQVVAAV